MAIVKIYERQKEWAIKAAAGIAAGIFFYVAIVQPVFQDIMVSRQGVRSVQKRLELYREIQNLRKSLDSQESSLATISERSQLLGRISDIAGRAQIHIGTMTPRTEPDGGFIKLKIEMDGQGSFFSFLKFLQAVEKMGAAIKVNDVSALWNFSSSSSDKSQKGKDSLQIQLVLETLLKQRVKKGNG